MKELNLPHRAPVLFAKEILFKESNKARVSLEFESLPSLAMMIEAAAQSSAAFSDKEGKEGFLVSLKNVKLLKNPSLKKLEVEVVNEHNLDKMSYISFNVMENTTALVTGSFVVAIK